jgi:ABC-2 type transport system permease protein
VADEVRLVMSRRRNWLLLAGLAAIPLVIGLAVFFYTDAGQDSLTYRILGSGAYLVAMAYFAATPLFLPLVVAVVGGESLAGEAQLGTLRYLVIAPVSRTRLLAVKAAGLAVFVAAAVAAVFLVALATGAALFGLHGLPLLSGDTLSAGAGVGRMAGIAVYVGLSLTGLVAVGLAVSSLTEVPLAAMAATAVVSVASTVMDQIPQLSAIHPGLLTHHAFDFVEFLRLEPNWSLLGQGVAVQAAWVAVCGSVAWARIVTADITA